MALVVPYVGQIVLLQYLLATQNEVLHLYGNNYTPTDSTTLANLTEIAFAGYAAVTLPGVAWTFTQPSNITTGQHTETIFTMTAGGNVYGYYVTDTFSNLLWVEEFPGAPFTLPPGGGQIGITPRITLSG
jgi:hypothetical protein